MVLADRAPQQRAATDATAADGAWLGAAQALALIPGVSRSGATLAAARCRGFARADAAALSREVALPVLLGAAALKGAALGGAAARDRRRRGGGVDGGGAARGAHDAAAEGVGGLPDRAGRRHRLAGSGPMTDAYAASGVDTSAADRGVAALVGVLRTISTGKASRTVPLPGHFAAVLEVAPNLGIAVGTDGVGSKLLVAEATGRLDTVGIDCIAMNVNDVVCVGAEPIAVLDYLAVEQADPDAMRAIAEGLKRGAELAGVEIPGGEVAVLPELIRGHPSPHGFDLTAACFGTVALDAIVSGAACAPGDALIGLPSSGLHSNGFSLARRALSGVGLDERPGALGRRHARRRAARADRDLRARGARAAALRPAGARARAHHRRRAAEPDAAEPGGRLRGRQPRCRSRRSSTSCASWATSPRPRCGRSSTWAAASAPWCRRPPPPTRRHCSPRTTRARAGSARSPTAPAASRSPAGPRARASADWRLRLGVVGKLATAESSTVPRPPTQPGLTFA